jgi:hypothetical protein
VVVAGVAMVRADLEDYRAMADAHARLLAEASSVVGVVENGDPVVVIRDEHAQPLVEILREPRGLPKLPFTRHQDPYGLIDTAALFEWVLADEGTAVVRRDDWADSFDGVEGTVIAHRSGGFAMVGPTENVAASANEWRTSGRYVRVIKAIPLD